MFFYLFSPHLKITLFLFAPFNSVTNSKIPLGCSSTSRRGPTWKARGHGVYTKDVWEVLEWAFQEQRIHFDRRWQQHRVLIVSSNGLMDNGIVEYNVVSSLDREFYSCSCKCMSMSACHADSHVPDRMEPKEEQKGLFPLQLTLLGVHTNGSARYGTKFSVLHS